MRDPELSPIPRRRSRVRRAFAWFGVLLVVWGAAAYLLLPTWWDLYFRRHPSFDSTPGVTVTSSGLPGDPVNVALIGTQQELKDAMLAAGWKVADPLGLRSDMRIAADTVLDRPYESAPVSSLFLFERREDIAFEMPVGINPQHRHHVRFWKSLEIGADDRPAWVGSASYDKGIGFSHTTGQITHHIAQDVDAERNHVINSLTTAGQLDETYIERDFHPQRTGHNGGGDPWTTDGDLWVGVLRKLP